MKTRDTRAQHDLSAEERQVNLSGSFRASESEVSGRRILLIDDVLTTGATARECIGALQTAGAQSVDLLVLAVTSHNAGHDGTGTAYDTFSSSINFPGVQSTFRRPFA